MPEDWRSRKYRQCIIQKIHESMSLQSNSESELEGDDPDPLLQKAQDAEKLIFKKTRGRQQYLILVSRLCLHFQEINNKKDELQSQNPDDQTNSNLAGGTTTTTNNDLSHIDRVYVPERPCNSTTIEFQAKDQHPGNVTTNDIALNANQLSSACSSNSNDIVDDVAQMSSMTTTISDTDQNEIKMNHHIDNIPTTRKRDTDTDTEIENVANPLNEPSNSINQDNNTILNCLCNLFKNLWNPSNK